MKRLRVKEIAEQRGLSMGQLGRLADLSHPTIRDMFRSPFKEVKSGTLHKLTDVLGVTCDALFEEVPDDEAPATTKPRVHRVSRDVPPS
jgi:transcriptional regulator with XRE-family HTH domain